MGSAVPAPAGGAVPGAAPPLVPGCARDEEVGGVAGFAGATRGTAGVAGVAGVAGLSGATRGAAGVAGVAGIAGVARGGAESGILVGTVAESCVRTGGTGFPLAFASAFGLSAVRTELSETPTASS